MLIQNNLPTYRWDNGSDGLRSHSIPAPYHASLLPVMAYACFGGLISNAPKLQDVEDTDEDLKYPDEEWGYHASPLQLAAFQLSSLTQACEAEDMVRAQKEVRGHDLTRRENAACKFVAITPLALTPILPSSAWLGDMVIGASPINTATRQFSAQCLQDGLHVLELFGGV